MIQVNNFYPTNGMFAKPLLMDHVPYEHISRSARDCGCHQHRQFFNDNRDQIEQRCRDRSPHAYRTDPSGCRWENGRVAQTQITQQSDTATTLNVGNNKVSIDKNNSLMHIQNADGTAQTVDLKMWGDPHLTSQGQELGTVKNDIMFTLKDGSQIKTLMGDGNGGPPVPGQPSYLNTVVARAPDGTGAIVTNISGPGTLGVTPLDSSYSSEFMENRTLGKFGTYEPSRVAVDRNGNIIDQSNGQIVHDQYALDRLDREQEANESARNLVGRGYVPQRLADQYDCDFDQYDDAMRNECESEMSGMLGMLSRLQSMLGDVGRAELPLARFMLRSLAGMQGMSLYA
ncbi:hypothetical protein [Xylophilus sp. GOD-11R]|uniref:hypothetical protein n=1 Tax=Xylophilus sp. GOD-11R TaxID=3089814 RepID=UPI00298CDCE5|nr:hypothetical protein [Xylophilus sp. GOD-11R]WPB57949.1 hypothetical protein R9X41_04695 [Xylophilus sp. GOD-11R]